MKNITVSVDDETYRRAEAMASRYGKSVSGMLGEYLKNLTAGYKDPPKTPERTLDEIIADIFARGGGLDPRDNLTRDELHDRNAFLFADGYAHRKLMGSAINADNAKKIEALFRERLERHFQGTSLRFDPIVVEPTHDQYDRDTFRVTVVFDGDYSDLKPGTLNSITSELVDEYEAMGIYTTVVDGYVSKEEWDMRDKLFLDTWEELNGP